MAFFSRSSSPEDEMKKAKAAYEKVISLSTDTRDTRSMRVRMGLLCCAHVDKTFVAGAEQTALWQDKAALALANEQPMPEAPTAPRFQKVKTSESEVFVYLPDEFAKDIFVLGAKYQQTHISAQQAIDAVQNIVNQLCRYELGLQEPFQALTFLREELQAQARAAEQALALAQEHIREASTAEQAAKPEEG